MTTRKTIPAPATEPRPTPLPAFPPSAELGAHLRTLHEAQVAIDRRKAEELARLREMQDRD